MIAVLETPCNSSDLVILGAGGNSREVAEAAQDCGWHVVGFLDDDPQKQGVLFDGLPVLGPLALAAGSNSQCVCTLGSFRSPNLRKNALTGININPQRWATIIHPATHIARSATIGIGSVVLAGAFVGAGARIGDHVIILQDVCVSHDCEIGSYATLTSGTRLAARVRVGPGAYLGMGSLLRNGVTVGSGALVGMGAVVTRDVPADSVAWGNPARVQTGLTPK